MSLVVITSDRFADHITPPGHPERVERAEAMQLATERWKKAGGTVVAPRAATDEDLLRVHDARYLASIGELRGRAAMLDADTFTSPESDEVARLAAGAVLDGVDRVLDGPARARAFAVVRPPGHHAEHDRAMGFCLYNNIAVGAAWARHRGVARVAIVDYDVHHGNGTQHSFYDDPTVLFISSHQFPFYPGTGAADEKGEGDGLGFTLNIPLAAGATDEIYDRRVSHRRRARARALQAGAHPRVGRIRPPRTRPARGDASDDRGNTADYVAAAGGRRPSSATAGSCL